MMNDGLNDETLHYLSFIIHHFASRSSQRIEFRANRVELFSQDAVALDGVAANLLIGSRGHPGQIRNVRLQARLPVAHRLARELRRNGVESANLLRVAAAAQA